MIGRQTLATYVEAVCKARKIAMIAVACLIGIQLLTLAGAALLLCLWLASQDLISVNFTPLIVALGIIVAILVSLMLYLFSERLWIRGFKIDELVESSIGKKRESNKFSSNEFSGSPVHRFDPSA